MNLVRKYWFLLVLILSLAIGNGFAERLSFLLEANWLKWTLVAMVMIAMTWPLKLTDIIATSIRPAPALLASAINLGLAPILAWPLSRMLGSDLGAGLIVASAVPSTLASGAVWTARAGGNPSVSLMVTIITNLVCFVVTPMWVYSLAGNHSTNVDVYETIFKLFVFVVVPMLAGQVLRIRDELADWADTNKRYLNLFAQCGVLFMVLIGSIKTGQSVQLEIDELLLQICLVSTCVVGIHLILFATGFQLSRWLGFSRADTIAVGISGSQKTMMIGLSAALNMGLNIIPLVAYHALQLIIDTLIADYLYQPQTEEN